MAFQALENIEEKTLACFGTKLLGQNKQRKQ